MEPEGASMRILVAIDGSEFSKNAVRFASCLATKIEAEVVALRVIEVPRYSHWKAIGGKLKEEMTETSKEMIEEAAQIAQSEFDMAITGFIREGSPVEEIVKMVKEDERITMVVLGASGKSHAARRLMGSTTVALIREVSRSLNCAVVVVPGSDELYGKRCRVVHSQN
jgi:nucleotide-binding universal stress UspA family protein